MPQNLICCWKASDMKALPWSWRSARPRAAPAERWPNRWRTAMPRAWIASKRVPDFPTCRARYRVTNWPEYDRALQRRGSLTVWVTPEALAAWHPPRTGRRGRSPRYAAIAIETGHLLRLAFGRPWRRTEGLLRSLAALLGMGIGVPDHTTFSRRSPGLALAGSLAQAQRTGPVHVVIDATGLQVHGAGEWLVEKHGGRGRRSWRKLVWGSPCQAFIAVLPSDASSGPAWPGH